MRDMPAVAFAIVLSFAVACPPVAQGKAAFVPVDACALLTKAEVEGILGRPALPGAKEQAANLVTCSFGDPDAPKIGGRPASQVLALVVFTGQESAHAGGPVAQARDAYEAARRSAASAEAVAGVGETAYWDKTFRTLSALKGRHLLSIEIDGGVETAKKAMTKAMSRLP